jgi:hypothetical protein
VGGEEEVEDDIDTALTALERLGESHILYADPDAALDESLLELTREPFCGGDICVLVYPLLAEKEGGDGASG